MVPFDFESFDTHAAISKLSPDAVARCKAAWRNMPKEPDWKTLALLMYQWAEGFRDMVKPEYPEVADAITGAITHEHLREGLIYFHEMQRVIEMTLLETMMTEEHGA